MVAPVLLHSTGEDGQLGLGNTDDQPLPCLVQAFESKHIVHVACGSGHSVALTADGGIYSFGRGDDGRLGHGDEEWRYVARYCLVIALPTVLLLNLQLGLHTLTPPTHAYPSHRLVSALQGRRVVQAVCGSYHTAIITDAGELWTWG